jgi:hypothetical protein
MSGKGSTVEVAKVEVVVEAEVEVEVEVEVMKSTFLGRSSRGP